METKTFGQGDPRLDWVSQHDEKSLNFPVRSVLASYVEERPRTWKPGSVLDQGREGACVGFAWTAELLASPRPESALTSVGNAFARQVYQEAQRIDEWEGEAYEGTSVLAGAKVLQSRGYFEEYRWAFSIEDVRDAVIEEGPVVLGIPWHEGMYDTRPSGLVDISGPIVGGHAITLYGYHPRMRIWGEDWRARHRVFRWRNSWGPTYGKTGNGLIRYEDLRDLLAGWGEACVPMDRKKVRL